MPPKSPLSPAIHNITFCGLTGAIFVFLSVAVVLYAEGFITTSWSVKDNGSNTEFEGLWQTCIYRQPIATSLSSQVLLSIGLFGVIVSFILSTIYMTGNRASKNVTIMSLILVSFITVAFVVSGVIVFGVHMDSASQLSWSYALTIASAAFTLVAGVLSILQMKRSNVRIC